MIKEETIDRIRKYLEKLPDIDTELAINSFSLLRLHHEVDMLSELLHARWGFNARQMETLETLFHQPEQTLTPAQLAEEVHLTRSAMTSNLDSLERNGYVSRSMHKEDRRMVAVTLTEKGIKFCEENLPTRYQDMAMFISILSSDERRILYDTYNRIADFLRQALKEDSIEFIKTSPARA
jgi:DNA-binding MarR family transcriptional regulator